MSQTPIEANFDETKMVDDDEVKVAEGKTAEVKEPDAVAGLDDDGDVDFKITAPDGKEYVLPKKYVTISGFFDKLCVDENANEAVIPNKQVSGIVLEKVIEYLKHHKGVKGQEPEKPLRSKLMKDVCKDPWDAEFITEIAENRQLMYDVILAANYLDIHCLLHLGCAAVASLIKGQPLEKIKEILSKGIAPAAGAEAEEKKE